MSPHIVVRDLRKVYRVPQREPGLRAAFRSVFRRQYVDCLAVDDVNFAVQPGEILGFIGPNGAGKTTTLKMLCGLLYPTSGEARVDGHVPWERRTEFLRRISMVMGNRHQLAWENTVNDSFHLLAEIYNVPRSEFADTRGELVDLLELDDLLPKMVRDLSLGERMKCELAAALLHRPIVLFLDEPTLGLDVSMQFRLRQFIARYNHQTGATVILTSHYMADVVTLCPRVILIHQGRLLFDGQLSRLAEQIAPFKLIRADLGDGAGDAVAGLLSELGPDVTLVAQDDRKLTLRVRRREASHVTARLLRDIAVVDLSVEDPPIEAVIDQFYRERTDS